MDAYSPDMEEMEGEAPEAQPVDPVQFLIAATQSPNMAADENLVPAEELAEIALQVIDEYGIDKRSRDQWEKRNAESLDLAMLVADEKNYPFPKASNVKFPLLTTAALQFSARAYPAIVKDNRVAKCVTWGKDPQGAKAARADRVSEHLSYQLLSEMPEWEPDTDRLLLMVSILGTMFRKVYWDPSVKRNCTRLITPDRLVINYHARSVDDVPRTTERMYLYPYEIQERIRSGRFIEFDYAPGQGDTEEEGKSVEETNDKDAPQLFLEQHRLLDLDGDGYPEPYIVTVHYVSQKVCRIVANFDPKDVHLEDGKVGAIRKRSYYVPYLFMPNPESAIYGWGFGWLLKDIGESINTTLNMMMDMGHQSTIQGGLVSAQVLGSKEKTFRLKPGEWRVVNSSVPMNQAMVPITYPGPSQVLFNLLGLLVDAGKEVSAVKDVLTGDTPANAPVGTTLALIEQGLQVFTSIYKRIHRAIKAELGLLAKLNAENLDPAKYAAFFDEPADPKADYSEEDMDILPISDPNSVSKMQTLTKAMFLMEAADKDAASPQPIINRREAMQRVLEAAQIEDVDKIILPPPQPNPEEEILKRAVAMNAVEGQKADILQKQTMAAKNLADAEGVELKTQVAALTAMLQHFQASQAIAAGQEQPPGQPQEPQDGQGGLPGMEGPAGNAMGAAAPAPQGPGGGGAMPQPALPIDGPQPGGMGAAPVAGGL